MSFKETPRFPDDISVGSRFGPGYSTNVARNLGGFEINNQNWSMPLYEGDVGYGLRTQAEIDNLLAFFHFVAGMHNGFRFKNYNDFDASGTEGTVVQLTGTTWQLYKTYTYGAATMARKISKPVSGTLAFATGSFSVDYTTGIITAIGSPTVAPTTWTGEFDTPVRFNTDKMLPQWLTFEQYEWQSIPIIEIRL